MKSVDWIWLYLKPRGRLTRLPYFLASMLVSILSSFIVYRQVLAYYPASAADPWATPGLNEMLQAIYVVTLWPMIALSAKRVQDIGLTPFLGAAIAVPGISMLAFFLLSLYPGTPGPNKYGAERNAPPAPAGDGQG